VIVPLHLNLRNNSQEVVTVAASQNRGLAKSQGRVKKVCRRNQVQGGKCRHTKLFRKRGMRLKKNLRRATKKSTIEVLVMY
jgi:hypothetical protein